MARGRRARGADTLVRRARHNLEPSRSIPRAKHDARAVAAAYTRATSLNTRAHLEFLANLAQ